MILVTGGTGLVGSHLLFHLVQKNEGIKAIHLGTSDFEPVKQVFRSYSDESDTLFNKIQWIEADLNDIPALEQAFEEVTLVYHCAAMISFAASDYQKMRRVNIEGTTNIVNLCISYKVNKLCFVSSVAAIENAAEGVLMDETDNWNNASEKSGYAITKYGAEMEVWRASQEGIPVVIVNPGVILGTGFWHKGSGKMFSTVHKGLNFFTTGTTGFIGVQDVVRLMMKLMDSNVSNDRFILVAENLSYKKVLSSIAEALGKKKPSISLNKYFMGFMWRLEFLRSKISGSAPLITKITARSSMSNRPYSSQKIKDLMSFDFEPINICIQRIALNFKK